MTLACSSLKNRQKEREQARKRKELGMDRRKIADMALGRLIYRLVRTVMDKLQTLGAKDQVISI